MSGTRYTPQEMIEKLIGFDTVSSKSNLALIEFVEDYLAGHGVQSRRIAERFRREGQSLRDDRSGHRRRRGPLRAQRRGAGRGATLVAAIPSAWHAARTAGSTAAAPAT